MKKNYLIILLGIGFLFSLTACGIKADSTTEPAKPTQETTVETSESTEIAAVTETEESTEDTTENTSETTVETTAETTETTSETTEVSAETTPEETVEGKEYFQYDGDIEPIVAETTDVAGVETFTYTPTEKEIEKEANLEEGNVMFRYATVKILVEVEETEGGRTEQFILEDVRYMLSLKLIPDTQKADSHKWFVDSDMYISNAVDQFCDEHGIGTHTYKFEICEVTNEYWSSKKWISWYTMNAHQALGDW